MLKVLYAQVGIGNGNASNTIQGDYNFWFPPQQEDRMDVSPGGHPGPTAYFVRYRPVFEAAPPGKPVSPDLAGRFAADFALGAQLSADSDPAQAQHLLSLARGVYAMAKTTDVGQLVTAFPHDYYPASQWKSDMAWGAAEIALADEATAAPARQLSADLATAARWARAYMAQGHPADGHIQPLRRRRGRRGRAAAGHAGGRRSIRSLLPCFWATSRLSCGPARLRPRATRSRSAPSSAPRTPRRTRSACSSPTPCTRSTAAPAPSSPSRSSS